MIRSDNKLTHSIISQLKQGSKIEFKWHGSDLLYTGRIEIGSSGTLFFINEHCFDGDKLKDGNEGMRYYNRLEDFYFFTHFKIIS